MRQRSRLLQRRVHRAQHDEQLRSVRHGLRLGSGLLQRRVRRAQHQHELRCMRYHVH